MGSLIIIFSSIFRINVEVSHQFGSAIYDLKSTYDEIEVNINIFKATKTI